MASVEDVAWLAFSYYPPLSRAAKYALQHLHNRITLRDVASAACLGETYFSTYFHKKVGVSFTAWLRLIRVATAVRLLSKRDTPVSDVARQVGFENVRTFHRSFKLLTGTTPGRLKQTMNLFEPAAEHLQILAQMTKILSHLSQISSLQESDEN